MSATKNKKQNKSDPTEDGPGSYFINKTEEVSISIIEDFYSDSTATTSTSTIYPNHFSENKEEEEEEEPLDEIQTLSFFGKKLEEKLKPTSPLLYSIRGEYKRTCDCKKRLSSTMGTFLLICGAHLYLRNLLVEMVDNEIDKKK